MPVQSISNFLSPAPPAAQRRQGQSVASFHAFIFAWPLPSFPWIKILAAAVTHPTLSWHWQRWEGKGRLCSLLPTSSSARPAFRALQWDIVPLGLRATVWMGWGRGHYFFCTVGASNLEQNALESAQRAFHYYQNKKCIIRQKDSMLLMLWRGFFFRPFGIFLPTRKGSGNPLRNVSAQPFVGEGRATNGW